MEHTTCPVREEIKTGDLLAWSQSPGGHESIWIKIVRLFTMSDYGHLSVAWKRGNGKLYHVEAVIPRIRITEVPVNQSFWLIPMSELIDAPVDMSFFDDKIGMKYGILDALRGYFGRVTKRDDKWQCAELTAEYYLNQGIELKPRSMTPSRVVAAATSLCNMRILSSKI